MQDQEEILIQENLRQKTELIRLCNWWNEEKKMTEKLSIENAKLKEENKLILSDKVSEIIGLLLLRNDAKNVSEYMDIVAELRDKMRELQDDIRDDLKDEGRRDVEYLETKNRRLERNYKVTLFSFYVLFGSWLVLAVKLFLL